MTKNATMTVQAPFFTAVNGNGPSPEMDQVKLRIPQ